MKQPKLLVLTVAVLTLSACTSIGTLQSTKADSAITGTVTRSAFEPYLVEVRLDGKAYRGEWRSEPPVPEQKKATSFPHRKHVGQVHATLKADDGSLLDCNWVTHGETAKGVCSAAGRDYPLVLN